MADEQQAGGAPLTANPDPERSRLGDPVQPIVADAPAAELRSGRFIDRTGRSTAVPLGLRRRRPLDDLYHLWLTARWRHILAFVFAAYLVVNALFAFAYLAVGGIGNAQPGSLRDAFFFSVQTFATIGYGKMVPLSLGANLIVTFEALTGLVSTAMITGLMFAKFARPTARVLWSRVVVVAPQDGVPSLMFRMANERGNQVVEAQVRLALVRQEVTAEGETVRRVHDLRLTRSQSAVFALTWTAIHPIDQGSIFARVSREDLARSQAELVASLTGLDETFSQTIHARHSWTWDEIAWDARFADILGTLPDGRRFVDYGRFHNIRPVSSPDAAQDGGP